MAKLSDYFQAVEHRLNSISDDSVELSTVICGSKLIFHFQTLKQADLRKPALTGLIEKENDRLPDAELFYWVDEPDFYIPEKDIGTKGVWTSFDETGSLLVVSEYGLIGVDHKRHRYYHSVTALNDFYDQRGNHPMVIPLLRWALDSGMIIMHSAAVGAGGRGVLICGRGGQGKSTLAISCMMSQMDFVSDDYVLLNQSGPLTAMPIYRTVGMNPDMEAILKPGLPVLRAEDGWGEKLLLDASGIRYCEELPIYGIIFPVLGDRPAIITVSPGKALTQLVHSSITQLYVRRNAAVNRLMIQRLQGIPVYEMRLGRDPLENAEFLKQFLCSNDFERSN